MPNFKPFKGVRPHNDIISRFPTTSLDNFTQEEINKKAQEDSSYIQMVKPFVVSKSKDIDRNLRKIRNNYEELLGEKRLVQDEASFYLYEQIFSDKKSFRGLLGLVNVEDFWNGKIKKHEATIPGEKEKMAHYLEKVNLQAEPVLLTYKSSAKAEMLMDHEEKNIPIINHLAEDGTRHKIWKIENRLKLQQFKEVFDQMEAFYIAAGHHKIGSVALNAKNQKEKNKKHNGTEAYNFVYSFMVSKESLKIHDYNRLLKDLNGLSTKDFLKKIEKSFLIHDKGETPYFPSQKFHISMYLDGKFYSLHVKHDLRKIDDEMNELDHFLLEKYIFNEILGMPQESKSNKIDYLKGTSNINGILKLKENVDSGNYIAGFGIYPVTFSDLIKISDRGIKMPPKCTLVEPKLITALIMYDMK